VLATLLMNHFSSSSIWRLVATGLDRQMLQPISRNGCMLIISGFFNNKQKDTTIKKGDRWSPFQILLLDYNSTAPSTKTET
jgi:hypothetical protein